ncbi:unnamed protein product [Pedinophyceae sp. YPF-701]|nr:unnamed protein product [Pedinophyceae sp. YPF-701]
MPPQDAASSFHHFLEKMKNPQASDLVRSIKTFVNEFEQTKKRKGGSDPESDSKRIQDFFIQMDVAFRSHPLWRDCSEAELEAAGEGLEKYVLTKLHPLLFATAPEDRERDELLSLHMRGLQFLKPEHLEIPEGHADEDKVAMAARELARMAEYKAPRDKLVCMLNCCRLVADALDAKRSGADDFIPLLIYVVVRAQPPAFESNLQYVQRFRGHRRQGGEHEYYLTTLVSVSNFVETIDANQLRVPHEEFLRHMREAGVPGAAHASQEPPAAQPAADALPADGPTESVDAAARDGEGGAASAPPVEDRSSDVPAATASAEAAPPASAEESDFLGMGAPATGGAPAAADPGSARGSQAEQPMVDLLGDGEAFAGAFADLAAAPPGDTDAAPSKSANGDAAAAEDGGDASPPEPKDEPPAAPPAKVPRASAETARSEPAKGNGGAVAAMAARPAHRPLPSLASLEAQGIPSALQAEEDGALRHYQFMYTRVEDLKMSDIPKLHELYKELAIKHEALQRAWTDLGRSQWR